MQKEFTLLLLKFEILFRALLAEVAFLATELFDRNFLEASIVYRRDAGSRHSPNRGWWNWKVF